MTTVTGDTKGVLGGGQVGCEYKFTPNLVIGIEGDGEAADIKGDVTDSRLVYKSPDRSSGNCLRNAWDRVMLYAKGGGAWVANKYSADLPALNEDALRKRAGQWAALLNGPFATIGPRKSSMISTRQPIVAQHDCWYFRSGARGQHQADHPNGEVRHQLALWAVVTEVK